MWRWLWHNGSHALAPVLRLQPEHSVKDCAVCAGRVRHKVDHIKPEVPLEYQKEAIARTTVDRFSLVLNRHTADTSSAHGKTLSDVFRNEFQCRINRILDLHQSHTIDPSADNARSELETLSTGFKGGDRLLVYWHEDVRSDEDPLSLISDPNQAVPMLVWLMVTRPLPDGGPWLSCRYQLDPADASRLVSSRTEAAGSAGLLRVYVLHPSSAECADEFTGRWLDVMQRNRYRLSVFRLLQEMRGTAVFRTNVPLNTKIVYYGFG